MIVKIKFTDDSVIIAGRETVEYEHTDRGIRVKGYTHLAKTVSVYVDGSMIEHVTTTEGA